MINDFHGQLERSESIEASELFIPAYHEYFKDIAGIYQNTAGKSMSQELGMDTIILLKSGKILIIDEKLREADYNDILIEFKSNSNSNTDNGWINKNLHIDYIAYGVIPTRKVFMLEWQALRRVWWTHGEEWKLKYKVKSAKNMGYNTLSVCVPYKILLLAMAEKGIFVP